MSFRDRLYELTTPEEVDSFLSENPNCAIFKAGGCHKTMQGFGYVEQVMEPRDALPVGFIKVIDNRPASNHVAEMTAITHESPQFILFKEGKPIFDVDNWDIVPEALEASLLQHFGPVTLEESARSNANGNIEQYIALLEGYIDDHIDEQSFTQEWLETFRMDNTLRSTEEFNLLNSLFGDVDLAYHSMLNGEERVSNTLKMRAETLLQQISSR
jgi:bacillithiol system protein YtxJ